MDDNIINARDRKGQWPNGALAAIALTLDNMGEAADLNRKLWPESEPVGSHFSVTQSLPKMLKLLKKYDISVTYFVESWNFQVYKQFILDDVVAAGHEVGWHAWQHEAWSKLDEQEEKLNFEHSFGQDGVGQCLNNQEIGQYRGFRPPGGIINGSRTLKLCNQYGLGYISPAGHEAALITAGADNDKLVVLPFKWSTVDAYYYMETFAGLRKIKNEELGTDTLSPQVLVQRYISEIDKTIESGGFLSLLFHPFLTERPERYGALEQVLEYLADKRNRGEIWLARCKDIQEFIISQPDCVGTDPEWDLSSWR